jgi:hypothetical protein
MKESNEFRNNLLAISLLMGFLFIVSFTIYYVREHLDAAQFCSCTISLPLIIFILSTLGVFVGSITYYFLASKYQKEKGLVESNITKTLDFLEPDERKIFTAFLENGEITQSMLVKKTGMDKVKVSRLTARLEMKKLITRQKHGMTNKLFLDDSLKELFGIR